MLPLMVNKDEYIVGPNFLLILVSFKQHVCFKPPKTFRPSCTRLRQWCLLYRAYAK